MPYEDILKRAEGHMTKKYDEKFQAVPDLKWNPWVGKNYHKTGILILGMSTDQRDGDDWTKEYGREASRSFFDFDHENCSAHGAFSNTSKMFLDGAGVTPNQQSHSVFWESVAFNNYVQEIVSGRGDFPTNKDTLKKYTDALHSTIKIIKPRLVVAWTSDGEKFAAMAIPYEERSESLGGGRKSTPIVCNQKPPIVGIQHPSWWQGHDAEWLNFLRNDPASKQPVEDFLQYLKQQPSN